MARIERGRRLSKWKSNKPQPELGKLRIIGGKFRGRQISYSGDPVTRPMKDNIREAVFNLVGGWIPGKAAFDLFAGTGAMGLEALSRGATRAFLIERHIPTVRIIRENVRNLDPDLPVVVASSDTFFWVRRVLAAPEKLPTEPWVVFCCPPYDFFLEQTEKLVELLESLMKSSPRNSLFVVESDERFDPSKLPVPVHPADQWRTRQYAPARVSVLRSSAEYT